MDNNQTVGTANYANLHEQISTLLNLSLGEIKKKYADYPHCLVNYFEKGIEEISFEIRFDEEEVTIICTFDAEENCNVINLFPDKNEIMERFITYLKGTCDYDFLKNRWITSNHYVKVQQLSDGFCFLFYG